MYRHHNRNVATHVENTVYEFLLKHNLRVLQGCPGVAAAIRDEGSARRQSGTGTDTHMYIHAFPFTRHRHTSEVFFKNIFWTASGL